MIKLNPGVPREIDLVGIVVVVASLQGVLHLDVWVTVDCGIGSIDLEGATVIKVP